MRRLSLALATVLLSVLGYSGAASHGAPGPASWSVAGSPFRITVLQDGKVLLREDAQAGLSYEVTATGEQHSLTNMISASPGAYTVATDEPGRTATVRISQQPHGVRISVSLVPAAGVRQVYDTFDSTAGEHFMGGGELEGALDLAGQVVPVKVSDVCSYAPVPFFISSAGYGLRLVGDAVSALAFPGSQGGAGCSFGSVPPCSFPPLADRVEVCMKGAELDEDVYPGLPAQVEAAYVADVGPAAVPPASQFALIKWRDEVSGPQDLLEDADRLHAAGIPVGWVLLDNPWETCPGTLQWDATRIPDPASLVQQLHVRRVKLMLWVSPEVLCGTGGYPSTGLIPPTGRRELDLTQPATASAFESRLRAVLSVGVDGVKGDRADEVDLEALAPDLHNTYPSLFARSVVNVLRSLHGDDFATIFRAATPGEQSVVHGFWAGDQPGDFTGLQQAIVAGETAGLAGMSVWGSDVGGFSSAGLTADVFMRWAQFGAISPVLEVGGIGPNATPWVMGPEAMTALQSAAILHYELFPYFMSLVQRGVPVLRPLAYAYPGDDEAWTSQFELLVGGDLLAAPVIGQGTTPSVYLPHRAWVDLYTGRTIYGPATFTRPTPLDQFPLYVRAGAVVPFDLRTAQGSWWGLNELQHRGKAGYLATNGARLALSQLPAWVQVFVPSATRPASVSIGGRRVAWTWNAGPLPGVVVRLRGPSLSGKIALS